MPSPCPNRACWRHDLELAFLVHSVAVLMEPNRHPRPLEVPAEPDWTRLVTLALDLKMLPLLALVAERGLEIGIPHPLQSACLSYLQSLRERNRETLARLGDVMALLADNVIDAATFKGFALAEAAWGEGLSRVVEDLDVLVPLADAERAIALLTDREFAIDPRRDLWEETHLFFPDDPAGPVLDLHRTFAPRQFPIPPDTRSLLAATTSIEIDGRSLPALAPADHLIVACIQLAKQFAENQPSLRTLTDIAALSRRIGAEEVARAHTRASAWGLGATLRLGLANANRLFAAPGTGSPLTPADQPLVFVESPRYVRECAAVAVSPINLWHWPYLLRLHENLYDRVARGVGLHLVWMIKVLFKIAFVVSEKDEAFLALPRWAAPLYPLIRLWRLVTVGRRRAQQRRAVTQSSSCASQR